MTPDQKRPVTVEALLQLKRLERPAPEFWDSFDRELRAKQLAALVAKRPWWRDLPSRFAGFRRYHIPLGATAILAITFVTVRDYQPAGVEHAPTRTTVRAKVVPQSGSELSPAGVDSGSARMANRDHERDVRVSADDPASNPAQDLEPAIDTVVGSGRTPTSIPLFLASGATDEQLTPSARSIAANLAAAEAAEPAVVRRLLGLRHGFESGGSRLEAAVEPLQQMSSPSEVRLARFDSPMARTASLNSPSRGDDRVARDIDVYERAARRIGGGGDRFIVKF